jgi:hypothetical protein
MKLLYILLLTFPFFSCEIRQSDYVDVKAVKQEIKDNKPKRIQEADIMQAAYKAGKTLADTLLRGKKIKNCGFLDKAALDSLQKNILIEAEWVCEIRQCKNVIEKQIWQAYHAEIPKEGEMSDNLQKIDDKMLLFSRPNFQNTALSGVFFFRLSKKEIIRQNF